MLVAQYSTRSRFKISSGSSQNYFGERAWPNDLLYIFPVCIIGLIASCLSISFVEPTAIGERSDPFSTPLEILPEWYFFPTFNLLRIIPNKLLGVGSMAALPIGIVSLPLFQNTTNFLNLSRRPFVSAAYLSSSIMSMLLGLGATQSLIQAIAIGL